jgi:hypothetical protein
MRRLVVFLLLCGSSTMAEARENPIKHAVGRALYQARRAVSIGPTLGAGGTLDWETPRIDATVSGGFGVFLFETPTIDPEKFQDMAKQKLEEMGPRILKMSKEEREQTKKEVLDELHRELDPPPKMIPDPTFDLVLEGGWRFRAEAWHVRASLGFGVGPVTIGPTLYLEHGSGATSFAVGPEIALHLLLGNGPAPLAVQLYARADFYVAKRDAFEDTASIGARVLFDLF